MDINYKIKDNKLTFYLDSNIYPLISVKKAMMNYTEYAFINAEIRDNRIQVRFEFFEKNSDNEKIAKDFVNDCLKESLRYDIAKETKNIRELILGRALYNSCIEYDNSNEDSDDEVEYEEIEDIYFDLNEIAVNWFDNKKRGK